MAYIRSLVANHDDAADLLQDLSLVVLARAGALPETIQMLRWCRGVARHLALHRRRLARRRNEIFPVESGATDPAEFAISSSPERALADRDSLGRFFRELDARSRRLLVLRYLAGRTSEEIARTSRQSPAAVRMKLMRLRKSLRRCVETWAGRDEADGPDSTAAITRRARPDARPDR